MLQEKNIEKLYRNSSNEYCFSCISGYNYYAVPIKEKKKDDFFSFHDFLAIGFTLFIIIYFRLTHKCAPLLSVLPLSFGDWDSCISHTDNYNISHVKSKEGF